MHSAAIGHTAVSSALRQAPVTIAAGLHKPPTGAEVQQALERFITKTNLMLREAQQGGADPWDVGAYVLWWVNHLHPFRDGNGRLARALACAVIVAGLGPAHTCGTLCVRGLHKLFHEQTTRQLYFQVPSVL